jgi:hypothetical protein
MKGSINFTFTEEQDHNTTSVECYVYGVNIMSKMQALSAMEQAMHMSEDEFKFYVIARQFIKKDEGEKTAVDLSLLGSLMGKTTDDDEEGD